MAQVAPPRSPAGRRRDTEQRLSEDLDLWVATASEDGTPHLVPLSFEWDGRSVLLATLLDSPTGRNLAKSARARLGLGHTRDVNMIDGDVEMLELDAVPKSRRDRFTQRVGSDPSGWGEGYVWFVVWPRRIQAWREENELKGRELMRDGRWLVDD